ncbi:unnamed protein product [Rotaria sp. Silwood1]|nr:unnamed protein product [Rotaria sp. Silwood1]CAF1606509.1 unnamed protein product [Rotaria sp. Silwood1]CAF3721021.1 unnamed protein product [Rotaria sp. Silwood1]CAF3725388.1 unnamed protein product [Rotaria sp. Silwood1]CAF4854046.1 unnamed protein product [Rotaria sp. Silwood1]
MRFYCHCLNVNIDVLEINDDHETISQFVPVDLVQVVNIQHEWFLCDVPSDQSIHITWQSLLQSVPVRDMKLNRCLGCHLYTHVTNIAPSRMLINKDLLDETTASTVYHDPSYSEIAKIVLPNKMNSINMPRLSSSQDENIQRECELAQRICRQSIEDIERETEEKIRMYQREQEELLEKKTEQFNKELDKFINLMRSTFRQTPSAKGSPTLQTSSSYINENSTESGFGSDIFDVNATDFGRHSSNMERTLSERNTNLDDETNDDPMLDNRGWFIDNGNINFATSLPKTIAFRPSNIYTIPHQEDDGNDDIERIGRSFRDLSRSMCTDGTEVFGDLPSPRLNARPT